MSDSGKPIFWELRDHYCDGINIRSGYLQKPRGLWSWVRRRGSANRNPDFWSGVGVGVFPMGLCHDLGLENHVLKNSRGLNLIGERKNISIHLNETRRPTPKSPHT